MHHSFAGLTLKCCLTAMVLNRRGLDCISSSSSWHGLESPFTAAFTSLSTLLFLATLSCPEIQLTLSCRSERLLTYRDSLSSWILSSMWPPGPGLCVFRAWIAAWLLDFSDAESVSSSQQISQRLRRIPMSSVLNVVCCSNDPRWYCSVLVMVLPL